MVVFEIPLATAPATLYLGQAVFSERADRRALQRDLRKSIPQLIVFQLLLRPLSVFRPFLNEVILLERNAMQSQGIELQITAGDQIPHVYIPVMYDYYVRTNQKFGPWGCKYLTKEEKKKKKCARMASQTCTRYDSFVYGRR